MKHTFGLVVGYLAFFFRAFIRANSSSSFIFSYSSSIFAMRALKKKQNKKLDIHRTRYTRFFFKKHEFKKHKAENALNLRNM